MRAFIFFTLLCLLGLAAARSTVDSSALNEVKCEDVLAADVCTKLREIAEKLKLKVQLIDQIIRQLVKEKVTEAKVIIAKVKAKLIELAKNFKCSDVLNEKVCEKIYEILKEIKVEAKVVDEFIKKLVVKGITKIKEIIEEIKKHFWPHLEGDLDNEVTCEDILAEAVCASLRAAAKAFKLKAEIVDQMIMDALAHGKQKAHEIYEHVRQKLIEAAHNFHCASILPENVCAKIEEVAAKLHVKMAKVEEVLKEIVSKGITKIKEIIDELKKHFFPHDLVNEVTCEDILAEAVCASLRAAAKAFKLKAEIVDQMIMDALAHGKQKAHEIYEHVRQKLIEAAHNFHCTTILPENVCAKIEEVAAKLHVKMAKVEEVLKEIVSKGITKIKEIIDELKKHFFPHDLVNEVTCEDILAEKVCASLRAAAKAFKLKAEIVDQMIQDALAHGKHKAEEIYEHVRQKLIEAAHNFQCTTILPESVCTKIESVAAKFHIKMAKVIAVMKDLVSKGITKIEEIIKELDKHFFPHELVENMITCEDVLTEEVCAALKKAAEKLKVKAAEVDKIVREAVEKGITKASEIIKIVRDKIVDLATNFKCEDALPASVCTKMREVAALVHVKFEKVTKFIKEIVAKGITKVKEIIEEIKKHFFPRLEVNELMENAIVCEEILSDKVCAALKKAAEKLKVKAAEVDRIVREAVKKGITKASEIIKIVRAKIVELATNFKCEDALSASVCTKFREVAAVLHVKFEKVMKVIKEIIAKGITKAKEIIEEIKKHFFPTLEIDELMENAIVCEEILSDKVCAALKKAAEKLKVKAAEVDKIVREAVKKGITKASEIIKIVRAKIVELATNFKCEDALSASVCAKMREVAKELKVNFDKVMKVMKEIIAKGITKAKEIIEEIKKHFFPHAELMENEITCEDILSESVCAALKKAAEKLKVKAAEVDKIVREAVKKGITKAKEIIKIVRAKIIELATNFKCEDALSADVCAKMREVAKELKVNFDKVMKVMKEIIAKGITKAKEIIEEIKKHFFPHAELMENKITCEDILSESVCAALKKAAEKLKVKAAEVDRIVREAVKKGITKAKEIIKIVRAKIIELATNFKCEDALAADVCAKLREVAKELKIKFDEVMKVMKQIIAKGITEAKKIIEYIKKHFFPAHIELENKIVCEDILSESVCAALKKAAEKLKVKAAEVDKIVREAVKKGITKAKEIIKIVRAKIIELATNFKCEDALAADVCAKLREVAKELKIKFDEVMKVMKQIIAKGITEAKKIIEYIKKHFFPSHVELMENEITCEDILSESVCAALKKAAEKLKVKAAEVDKIVREAVKKGITKAKEIIKIVRAKIIELATNFKCEDALAADVCAKMREVAKELKVNFDKVMKVMKEIIAKGITKAKEIIEEIKKHFFPHAELENKIVCEDILSDSVCAALKKAAEKLKVKAAEVDKIVREAVKKGITKAKEIIKIVRAKIIELATNFKCEDALAADVCAKMREVAKELKVNFDKVMKVMKEIIAKGITKAKEIIEEIKKHFFPHAELENKIVCEDILSDSVCAALKKAAEKLKVKAAEVDKIVREAVKKGITKAKEIIKIVRAKIIELATNFKCEDALAADVCAKMREVAKELKVNFDKVMKVMKEIIAKGITKAKEIIEEIKKHFFPHAELENKIVCEDILSDSVCAALKKAAEKLKVKAAEVDKIVREAVKKGITKAKEIIKIVRAKIIELATNFKCEDALAADVCAKMREVAKELKVNFDKVMKVMKEIIAKGITKAKEIIEEIKKHFFPHNELENMITCEDILAGNVCKTLKKLAEKLKVKAAEVDRIVREAVKKGITKAKEIIKIVRAKIVELATNFKCEDALAADVCAKLRKMAHELKIKFDKVLKFMKDLIAKGIDKAKEIIEYIKKHFFPHSELEENAIVCEEILSESVCAALKKAAEKLKVKAAEVDRIVREAVKKGITKATEIAKIVRAKIIELATNFKCEDALSASVCTKMREVAKELGVKFEKVMKVMKEIIAKGITKAKEIIEEIKKHFFPTLEVNELMENEIVCEEILSEKVCAALKKAAEKLKVKAAEVDRIVREAVKKGITKATEIAKIVRAKIVELATNFKCEDALSAEACAKIREVAAVVHVKMEKVMKVIKEIIAKGITKAKEIIDEIKKHFFPTLEIDDLSLVKCEDVLSAKVCTELRTVAKKLKVKVEEIDNIIRKLVKEKITDAKRIIKEVRAKLVELAKNFKCTDVLSEAVCKEIKDFAAKIKIEAKKVDEIIKKIVVEGVTKAKEIIKKIIEHFFPKP